jgi:hypothetical protein
MPAAEIAAGITSIRAAIDIAQAVLKKRDAKLVAAKMDEMTGYLSEALGKLIQAQQAQLAQLDEIAALKAEIKKFGGWEAEKQRYELKGVGRGISAYMLKPAVRSAESPHWLCPTCFENGKKSHLQFSTRVSGMGAVYRCAGCGAAIVTESEPAWS